MFHTWKHYQVVKASRAVIGDHRPVAHKETQRNFHQEKSDVQKTGDVSNPNQESITLVVKPDYGFQ